MKAVAYFRVSTAGQGRSGLGLDAQKAAVHEFSLQRGLVSQAAFTEVESGKRSDRPELQKALHLAKVTGAVLVIAKLDRLSRNAAFLLTLRDSGVRFLAADIPDANDLTIGVLAVIAQAEREAISRRTKEALHVVKLRLAGGEAHTSSRSGRTIERLGNPNGASALAKAAKGNSSAVCAVKSIANARGSDLAGLVSDLQGQGFLTLASLAEELNRQGVLTPRRRSWHPSSVRNLLARIALLEGSWVHRGL